jgi:hypothetical protein
MNISDVLTARRNLYQKLATARPMKQSRAIALQPPPDRSYQQSDGTKEMEYFVIKGSMIDHSPARPEDSQSVIRATHRNISARFDDGSIVCACDLLTGASVYQ